MGTLLRTIVVAVFCLPAPGVSLSAAPAAHQEAAGDLPVSLERIREELEKMPTRQLEVDGRVPLPLPVATFRSGVDQRVWVMSLDEWLHKQFDLNLLQQQSAHWTSMCCGLDLGMVFNSIDKALQQRKIRKIREQVTRELAEVEAARRQAVDVK